MSERLVRLGHLVNFVTFADGIALPLIGFQDFRGERVAHRLTLAGISEIHNPPECQGGLTVARNFQWNLVGGTTYTTGLGFNARLGIVHGTLQDLNRIAGGILFRNALKGTINNALCSAFLPECITVLTSRETKAL